MTFDDKKIIDSLSDKPISFHSLVKKIRIDRKFNKEFSKHLFSLIKAGKIFNNKDGQFYIPKIIKTIIGEIRITSKGFGFVDEEEGSIFISSFNTNGALDKDEVEIQVFADNFKEGKLQGLVLKVTKRSKDYIVGTAVKFGKHWGLQPFNGRLVGKFRFIDTKGLIENHEIKAEILDSKNGFTNLKLLKVIGDKNDAKVDIETAIIDSGVRTEWPNEVSNILAQIPDNIDQENKDGRVDIRDRLIVTIDGDDSKDFDDAIEVKKLANGNYFLGVHIADVTHYVKENEPLDNEALLRGTSVYLVDRVIPMLPEKLSNGICSLNPHVDRFVLSCEMEINPQGHTVSTKVYPGIINSKHRLTYNQVNDYFDKKEKFDPELSKMIDEAVGLASIIREFKTKEGYIDFEIEESKLILNDKGDTVAIIPRPRGASEMLIEDFMVRANESVAQFVADKKLPFIYRVHDKPNLEKLATLQDVVKVLGLKVLIPQSPVPLEFARAIKNLKEQRFDDFMKIMMLRTMQKAEYAKNNIGHFGLASKYYSHFTSPIRRYPDLMVHRMLREYFFNNNKASATHFDAILDGIATSTSAAEVKAMELERSVNDIKKAEYYERFIGKILNGQIVSMQKFGFFVEFADKVDGLVHIKSLKGAAYELIDSGFTLTNGKRSFTIGEFIDVLVIGTDKQQGKIDLSVLDEKKKETK